MLKKFFNLILKHNYLALFFSLIFVAFIASFIPKLQIDASAETLLLDDDKDLQIAREVAKKYKSPEILVVAFSPKDELLSNKSLNSLKSLTKDLEKLEFVDKTTSILNVPLFQSPVLELKDLTKHIPSLKDEDINLNLVKNEFLTSPLYQNNLVSSDFKTTAVVINLKPDLKYMDFLDKKQQFKDDKAALLKINAEFKAYRDSIRDKMHQEIIQIRQVLKLYQDDAQIFLGGVNMIADDMISYVKSDLVVYGSSLALLLSLSLYMFFRQIKWVVLPLFICFLSVVVTAGVLGIFGWEITVISSNFVSLQLIITVSIVLHLIVRYRELLNKFPNQSQKRLVLQTVLSKLNPSFFAILTTVAGFSSLVFSHIKPVINLGLMMSVGIILSLIMSFVVFACVVSLLPKIKPNMSFEESFSLTKICGNWVLKYGKTILFVALIATILGAFGSSKIIVENSFIDYFKKSTEIYKGMEVIDKKLGGTTPLDVIVKFKDKDVKKTNDDDFLSEFEDEFNEQQKQEQYWFSKNKMDIILKIHNYLNSQENIGNVTSLATMLKVGKIINNNNELDSFALAVLYNEIPQSYKEQILSPYINIDDNEARFSVRIVDSSPTLRRDEFLKHINQGLNELLKNDSVEIKISGMMVLYNNMLQSLFTSQIDTFGSVLLVLGVVFWIIFGSLKLSLIALVANVIPIFLVFGIMGFFGIPLDMMSITIAAISVGIGVDDTIHYIHRFKDELRITKDYKTAILNSHASIGYAMYYTSFAIILGFCVLVVSNFIPTIYFGLLTVLVMSLVLSSALLLLPKLIYLIKPYKTQGSSTSK